MFEGIKNFLRSINLNTKKEDKTNINSKETAKERLHLVLLQDRANVSADFLELMKQEIIEVIKKYIEVDEEEIDVRLTNQVSDKGDNGAPMLYANIPILKIKEDMKIEDNSNALKKDIETKKELEYDKQENVVNVIVNNTIEENREDIQSNDTNGVTIEINDYEKVKNEN